MKNKRRISFHEDESICIFLNDLSPEYEKKSPYYNICIYKHPLLGKILTLNDEIQHIEAYESIYHENLTHIPTAFIKNPEKALVLGGGSLFAAHELMKYKSIKHIKLCDHDELVINACCKYYDKSIKTRFDKRLDIQIEDVFDFLISSKEKYDIIINDCFNIAIESKKRNINLYQIMENSLTESGICSDIVYRHIFDSETFDATLKLLKNFPHKCLSLVFVPEYPGILHIETMWGKNKYLSQNSIKTCNLEQIEWSKDSSAPFLFYQPNNLGFYTYLPPYIKRRINL